MVGRERRTTKPIMSVWQQTFGHASNEKREKLSWREGATRWEKQRGRADEKEEELLARLLAVHGANGGGAEERRWVSTTVCLWPRGRADNVNSDSVKASWDVTPSCTHPTSQTCSCLTFILKFFTRSGKENKGVVWRTQQKYKLLKRFSELLLFVTHPSKSRVQEGLPWCHVVEFTLTLCTQIHDVHRLCCSFKRPSHMPKCRLGITAHQQVLDRILSCVLLFTIHVHVVLLLLFKYVYECLSITDSQAKRGGEATTIMQYYQQNCPKCKHKPNVNNARKDSKQVLVQFFRISVGKHNVGINPIYYGVSIFFLSSQRPPKLSIPSTRRQMGLQSRL